VDFSIICISIQLSNISSFACNPFTASVTRALIITDPNRIQALAVITAAVASCRSVEISTHVNSGSTVAESDWHDVWALGHKLSHLKKPREGVANDFYTTGEIFAPSCVSNDCTDPTYL
jgi:hypothetical protein